MAADAEWVKTMAVTEVMDWYKNLAIKNNLSDDVITRTILANFPEVEEVLSVQGVPRSYLTSGESKWVRVRLQDGTIEGTHVYEATNGMMRLMSRWDGSWGRRIELPDGEFRREWPGCEVNPEPGIQPKLF